MTRGQESQWPAKILMRLPLQGIVATCAAGGGRWAIHPQGASAARPTRPMSLLANKASLGGRGGSRARRHRRRFELEKRMEVFAKKDLMVRAERMDERICPGRPAGREGPAGGVFTKQSQLGKTNPFSLPGLVGGMAYHCRRRPRPGAGGRMNGHDLPSWPAGEGPDPARPSARSTVRRAHGKHAHDKPAQDFAGVASVWSRCLRASPRGQMRRSGVPPCRLASASTRLGPIRVA